MSLPCHQPEKWNGMKAWSGPTPSVILAVTLIRAPVGVFTQTCSPFLMWRSAAAFGLISTKFSCINSASHGLERVSSPPPSYSTRRPLVRTIGKSLPMFLFLSCTDLYSVGSRQKTFTSSWVGYLSTRSARMPYSGSRCCGMPSGKFHTIARALALPNGWQPWFFLTTRWMPPERSVAQLLPSASFFSSSVSSSHQPSFFTSTWSNSGYPVLMSAPFEYEPSSANRLTPSFSTPKLPRKLPPPSMTCLEVSYKFGEPGCLSSAFP